MKDKDVVMFRDHKVIELSVGNVKDEKKWLDKIDLIKIIYYYFVKIEILRK